MAPGKAAAHNPIIGTIEAYMLARLMWWTTPARGIECHRVIVEERIT